MQVVTESYRKADSTERSEDFAAMKARRAKMCEALNLQAQVSAQAIAEEAAIFYKEITGYELAMWREFLPTAYEDFAEYSYDVIPEVALEDIVTANNMNIFSTMEIWTPEIEVNSMDPMAVGITGVGRDRRFFPIVRWGAEKLLTPEQIERVVARRQQDRWRSYGVNSVPETILDHIVAKFRESEGVYEYGIRRASGGFMRMRRCCGKKMYALRWFGEHPDENVCAECGNVRET
ncbi:MAG: hypothetical protein Q7S53_03435 [bacterium]|nr:hypothetical protein [bacterium]